MYVTNDIFYAITFLKSKDRDFREVGYITKYNLNTRLNIFNARYGKDYQKIEDYCRKYNLTSYLRILPSLKDLDWIDVFKSIEDKNDFIDILKDLNYDGFFNIENYQGSIFRKNTKGLKREESFGFSGIGIFDETKLRKIEIYHGWENIKEIEDLKPLFESAKIECSEDALKFYNSLPDPFKKSFENSNNLKNKLAQKIAEESYLPYFLMLDNEIKEFIQNFDFELKSKELKNIERKLKENCRNLRNKYLYLTLENV